MSSIGHLYGATGNSRVSKSLLTAKLSGVKVDFDPNFRFGVDNYSEGYLKKFPMGQTPAFEGKDGLLLTESASIPLYIASHKPNNLLLGANQNEYNQIMQQLLFVETSFSQHFITISLPFMGVLPYDEVIEARAYAQLTRPLNHLNNILQDKTYLVGNKLTFADINTYFVFFPFYNTIFGRKDREQYPHITKYLQRLNNHPEFIELTGKVTFSEERAKFFLKFKHLFNY